MLEIILLGLFLFLIMTFFYKQATTEFRINQVEWAQRTQLSDLLVERVPTVLRGITPLPTFWTQEDVTMRPAYGKVTVFAKQGLPEWLAAADAGAVCPWQPDHAASIAVAAGLPVWSRRWLDTAFFSSGNDSTHDSSTVTFQDSLQKFIVTPLSAAWYRPVYRCWAGARGLAKTVAPWTAYLVTEGEITVTILPKSVSHALPAAWQGCFPADLTQYDTPFIGELNFMDIVLRPGTALFMPAHWFVSWRGTTAAMPMVCAVEYHTPVSRFAGSLGTT